MPKKQSDGAGASYEIGYREPPKRTRFRTGQSGNPRGRPPGSKTVVSTMDRVLAREITMTVDGKRKRVTVTEAMFLRAVQDALTGNPRSGLELIRLAQALSGGQRSSAEEEPKEKTPEEKLHLAIFVDCYSIVQGLTALGACEISESGRPKLATWFFELALANRPEAAKHPHVDTLSCHHVVGAPDN